MPWGLETASPRDERHESFFLGGRTGATSAVLTLTNKKPSFLLPTYEKVLRLRISMPSGSSHP